MYTVEIKDRQTKKYSVVDKFDDHQAAREECKKLCKAGVLASVRRVREVADTPK